MIKTFWCVNYKYFDSGYVKILIYDVKAEVKPEDRQVNNKLCTEYENFFDSFDEANLFADELKQKANVQGSK